MMNKRTEGTRYERMAEEFLTGQGYRIIDRNFRCRRAEIDLVAREGKYLVFLEVKERSSDALGAAAQAVDRKKQDRICAAARFYLYRFRIDPAMPVRFDVVTIDGGKVRLIRNAFLYRE
jgi:putative endonuclease